MYAHTHTPAAQPNCLVSLEAALSGSDADESPTSVCRPPERPDGGFELDGT